MESTITNVKTNIRKKNLIEEPPQYKVIMYNDDVTTMDFVVAILQMVFQKKHDEAVKIMLHIHNHGSAVVGIYSLDIAISKINKTHQIARANGFPLTCTYEKA